MKKAVVNVGVVGMGHMGHSFAQILTQLPDACLVGVSDTEETIGRAAAAKFNVPYYRAYDELIAAPDVQAVIVATWESAHVGPSVAALESGKGVLVEKPIADNVPDACRIIDAAKKAGAVLQVGHSMRFDTNWCMAKQLVDEGRIGAVQYVQTRLLNGTSAQKRLKGRCSLPLFLGVHHYDFARWIIGSEPVRVYAQSQFHVLKAQGFNVEDSTLATFTFANGALAVCEAGWILPPGHPNCSDKRVWIQGTGGRLDVELLSNGIMLATNQATTYVGTGFMPVIRGEIRGTFVAEVQHFLDCIREHKWPLITPEDGLMALKMAEAVMESARTNNIVQL